MPPNTENKTRTDYHAEQYKPVYEKMVEEYSEDVATSPRDAAREVVRREDELIWAFHRDPLTDLTQVEARDRAQSTDYPDRYNLSQSTISRKLSQLDDRMLTEPVDKLNMEERTSEDALAGILGREELEAYKNNGQKDVLEKYRQSLARMLVDMSALSRFMDGESITPEWARRRFADIDPDSGRDYYLKTGMTNGEVHPPQSEVEAGHVSGVADD